MHLSRLVLASLLLLVASLPVRAAEPVTFNRDVAPILFSRCTSCHRPGEIGPFSLQTYRDARQRMTLIADATKRRVMPPWKPESAHGTYVEDRSLTDAQIQTAAGGGADVRLQNLAKRIARFHEEQAQAAE